jgi:hypothetical protein
MRDGRLVPLGRTSRGPLPRPSQAPQDLPDVARVVRHAGHRLDQHRDPWQSPEVGRIPLSQRTAQQVPLDPFHLLRREPWSPARSTRADQSFPARRLPRIEPAHDTLPADTHRTRNLGLRLAALEHRRRAKPALPHSVEITSRRRHAASIASQRKPVTLLREAL